MLMRLLRNIQGDSETGGNILGICSTDENKVKPSHKHQHF
jgi:hypothetical protein